MRNTSNPLPCHPGAVAEETAAEEAAAVPGLDTIPMVMRGESFTEDVLSVKPMVDQVMQFNDVELSLPAGKNWGAL